MVKQTWKKKLLSAVVSVGMMCTSMPTFPVFAAGSYKATAENGVDGKPGPDAGDTVTITAVGAEIADPAIMENWKELFTVEKADMSVGSFGDEAEAVLNEDGSVTITLGETGLDINEGDSVKVAENVFTDGISSEGFSVVIEGSFGEEHLTKINFVVVPANAEIKIEGYDTIPEYFGVGEYKITITEDTCYPEEYYITITEETSSEITLEYSLMKLPADITDLDEFINEAEFYLYNDVLYTTASIEALKTAYENAIEVRDGSYTIDEQAIIDAATAEIAIAIDGMQRAVKVSISAIAVCSDVEKNYGKADNIYVTFDRPTNGTLDAAFVTVGDLPVTDLEWDETNTILKLVPDSSVSTGAVVKIQENSAFRSSEDEVILATEAEVEGNLDGAEEFVAPSAMMAVIIKVNDKAGANEGDIIKVIFNAPVKDDLTPEMLNSGLAGSVGEFDESATVYTITLGSEADISDKAELKFAEISTVLTGSFGKAVVPKVLSAKIEDTTGNSLTKGDKIYISFSAPTNGKTGTLTGPLAGANAAWEDGDMTLVIELGDGEITNKTILDLSDWGIMDKNETVDAEGVNNIRLIGSFGKAITPKIIKAIAYSLNDVHMIRVMFNESVMIEDGTINVSVKTDDGSAAPLLKSNTVTVKDENNEPDDFTFLDIALESGHTPLKDGVKYSIEFENSRILDFETGTVAMESYEAPIIGNFSEPITPEVLSATYISADGSGIQKDGDKIIVVLNTSVANPDDMGVVTIDGETQNDYTVEDNCIVISPISTDIKVKDEKIISKIKVEGFVDSATERAQVNAKSVDIGGSMGKKLTPELLSFTYISKDGSGVQKAGDKVTAVFNTEVKDVKFNGTRLIGNGYIFTYEVNSADSNFEIGGVYSLTAVSNMTEEETVLEGTLSGSMGNKVTPEVVSMTYMSADGSGVQKDADTITVVFNVAVELKSVKGGDGIAIGEIADSSDNGITYTVKSLKKGKDNNGEDIVKIGGSYKLIVTSKLTGGEDEIELEAVLGGSMGNKVEGKLLSMTYVSADGSGVQKAKDKVILVFNTPVKDVKFNGTNIQAVDGGYTFIYNVTDDEEKPVIGNEYAVSAKYADDARNDEINTSMTLGGSMGNKVVPTVVSAVYVSADGNGVQKEADKVVIVFNTPVSIDNISSIGSKVESSDNIVFTVTELKSGLVIGNKYTVEAKSIAAGEPMAETQVELKGSMGYAVPVEVVSATAKTVITGQEYTPVIDVIFDGAVNINIDTTSTPSTVEEFNDSNESVKAVSVLTLKDSSNNVLGIRIKLSAETKDTSIVNLSKLGIKSEATGKEIDGLDSVAVKGAIYPVVTTCVAESAGDGTILINFTSPVTSAVLDKQMKTSQFATLYGTGSYAEIDGTLLTIHLGENAAIKSNINKYAMLTGLGIRSSLCLESSEIAGLYSVSGSFVSDKQKVSQIKAGSASFESSEAAKGDVIRIVFEAETNIPELSDLNEYISVVDKTLDEFFGTGYSAQWENLRTLKITLGGKSADETVADETTETPEAVLDPTVKVGDEITVKGIAFANGEGMMEDAAAEIGGSFNGREFTIEDASLKKDGDYIASAKIVNNLSSSNKPVVVCAVYNGKTLLSIHRTSVSITDSEEVIFDIPAKGGSVSCVKIMVFDSTFRDINETVGILAETVTCEISKN